MQGPETRGMTTVPLVPATVAALALDSSVPDQRSAPATDLVTLHESIARLLAVQGNYKRAYSHLNAALRLARDAECSTPIIPEQYRIQVAELRRAHAEAVDASLRDPLTSCYNRRYLDQQLDDLIAEHTNPRAGGDGIAVALVDLDLFKQVNDGHGHLLGDRVLRQVVRLLQTDLPDDGFCARYGGEEFAIVLPGVSALSAVDTLEAARARVAEYPWATLAAQLKVTISAGLAHFTADPLCARLDADDQLRLADEAMYAAKRAGRNAVGYRLGGAIRIAGLDDECR